LPYTTLFRSLVAQRMIVARRSARDRRLTQDSRSVVDHEALPGGDPAHRLLELDPQLVALPGDPRRHGLAVGANLDLASDAASHATACASSRAISRATFCDTSRASRGTSLRAVGQVVILVISRVVS